MGLPGYLHPAGGVFMIEPLEIGQAQRLDLVPFQVHLRQSGERNAAGLEKERVRRTGHPAAAFWSGHWRAISLCSL